MFSATMLTVVLQAASVIASPALLIARESCSAPEGAGSCMPTSSCSGFHVAGYCSGGTNNQCCIEQTCSTSGGSGTCKNTDASCSGSFVAGACPGSSSVQCCIVGSTGGGGSSGGGNGAGHINDAAVELIEGLEGFSATYYYINGDKTIGYGHDCTQKQDCAGITEPISQAQATDLFKKDVAGFESCVCDLPNASALNANQFGALVSFAYNSGCGGVASYWESKMSASDFAGICAALPTTNTLGGQLSSRRQKEGTFCSQATDQESGC